MISRLAERSAVTLYGEVSDLAPSLLQAGVPVKVASEMLGHASVTITYDTYSHVIPGMAEDATSKVAALLFPA